MSRKESWPQATGLTRVVEKLEAIFTSKSMNLRDLATAASLDPSRDFRNISLNGIPLDDQDVSGFDFSNSDLRGTGIQKAKRDARTKFNGALFDGLSLEPSTIALNKALKELRGRAVFEQFGSSQRAGVKPDVITFSTLLSKSPDLGRVFSWRGGIPESAKL